MRWKEQLAPRTVACDSLGSRHWVSYLTARSSRPPRRFRRYQSPAMRRRSFRGVRLLAALLGGVAAACGPPSRVAQTGRERPPVPPACSTARLPQRDTLLAAVFATTGFGRPAPPALRTYRQEVLRSVLASYPPPERLSAPSFEAAAFARDSVGFGRDPLFDGELVIVLDGDGRLQNVRVEQSPRTPELIAGLVAAIFRADSAGALPSRPPAL